MDKNQKLENRSDKLFRLGLKYNGQNFLYHDINFHWTDLTCMSDEEFEKAYEGAVNRKKQIDEEVNHECASNTQSY
jgi:hypothetical protein